MIGIRVCRINLHASHIFMSENKFIFRNNEKKKFSHSIFYYIGT